MKRFLILLIIVLAANSYTKASAYKDSLQNILKQLYKHNMFIGNISVFKNGNLDFVADFDTFKTETENYHIGSVSKMFTATIIFQLIEENKLSLDAKLDQFFPEIKHASQITIANLLSHTSGIYNITDWEKYYETRTEYFSRNRIIELITSKKPEFKPNKDCYYSNSNYVLLSFIIEDLTKQSYSKNIQERICDKLSLKHTFCPENDNPVQPTENSFKFNGENWIQDSKSNPSLPIGAGAVVSTSTEICVFVNALFRQKLISNESLGKMMELRNYRIGHGIFKAPFYNKVGWGHSGRIDEFRAFVAYFPEDSICIGITTNGMNMKLNDLILYILSIIYNKPVKAPEFAANEMYTTPTSVFVGNYKAKLLGVIPVAKFNVSQAAGNFLFMAEGTFSQNQDRILLERKGELAYYSSESGGYLDFEVNKKGDVKRVILTQGKLKLKCRKIKKL
ncbi:MAG: beta-lactamase family protein [Flavobacteriales bacterium]|nr:beta-lactamase family protein [Flavobacteriales bacterium]